MTHKHVLLASFVKPDQIDEAYDRISSVAGVERHRIFAFRSSDIDDYVLTYNLSAENANVKFTAIWPDTISVHRKKDTNTIFSLNALNELIKSKNGGRLVMNYKIDWQQYKNCFLLFRSGRLTVLQLELVKLNR